MAAAITIGCLFLFTYVLPPPSPSFPSHRHTSPVEDERGVFGYIDGVERGDADGVRLTVHVNERLGERNETAKWLGGLLFEDIAVS